MTAPRSASCHFIVNLSSSCDLLDIQPSSILRCVDCLTHQMHHNEKDTIYVYVTSNINMAQTTKFLYRCQPTGLQEGLDWLEHIVILFRC